MSTLDKELEQEDLEVTQDTEQQEAAEAPSEEEVKKEEKTGFFGKKKNKDKDRINELEQELGEAKDKYLRLYAEFDNYKKRTVKERLDLISTAGRDTISSILPVLDDFDRAKKSAEDESSSEEFSEGVMLVYNKLHGILSAKGVKPMESTGEDFDPELHEAITEIPAASEEQKGKVIDTVETGYFLNDKIIRHAKVVVGK